MFFDASARNRANAATSDRAGPMLPSGSSSRIDSGKVSAISAPMLSAPTVSSIWVISCADGPMWRAAKSRGACGSGNAGEWVITILGIGAHGKPGISLLGIGAPSVCLPESVIPSAGAAPFFRVSTPAVRLPESFRGGCSFGAFAPFHRGIGLSRSPARYRIASAPEDAAAMRELLHRVNRANHPLPCEKHICAQHRGWIDRATG